MDINSILFYKSQLDRFMPAIRFFMARMNKAKLKREKEALKKGITQNEKFITTVKGKSKNIFISCILIVKVLNIINDKKYKVDFLDFKKTNSNCKRQRINKINGNELVKNEKNI